MRLQVFVASRLVSFTSLRLSVAGLTVFLFHYAAVVVCYTFAVAKRWYSRANTAPTSQSNLSSFVSTLLFLSFSFVVLPSVFVCIFTWRTMRTSQMKIAEKMSFIFVHQRRQLHSQIERVVGWAAMHSKFREKRNCQRRVKENNSFCVEFLISASRRFICLLAIFSTHRFRFHLIRLALRFYFTAFVHFKCRFVCVYVDILFLFVNMSHIKLWTSGNKELNIKSCRLLPLFSIFVSFDAIIRLQAICFHSLVSSSISFRCCNHLNRIDKHKSTYVTHIALIVTWTARIHAHTHTQNEQIDGKWLANQTFCPIAISVVTNQEGKSYL